jgi:glyoxylase-like metal-dependent hydrolase (beta-lactamase superfamily II)
MQQIIPQVYRLSGLVVGNVYLIEDPDGLTLIDASIPPSGKKIIDQIVGLGRKPADVKRILITHGHPDHIGSLPELKERTGAQVICSELERPVIEGKAPIARIPAENRTGLARVFVPPETILPGTPVDRVVKDGELIDVMGGLQVVATSGHAPGHLSFWEPAVRILFCGDVIFHLPFMGLPFSFFTVDMEENKRSIQRLAQFDVETLCFGHGSPIKRNAAQRLRSFAEKVQPQASHQPPTSSASDKH